MASLGVFSDGLSWFMRSVAKADVNPMMRNLGRSAGERTAAGVIRMGQGMSTIVREAKETTAPATAIAKASERASFEAMSIAEKKSFLRNRRLKQIPGDLAKAGLFTVASAPITVPLGGIWATISWNAMRGRSTPDVGPIGYPGTDYNPPPTRASMGADGDIVHALHNIHGTGKNRGLT